MYQAGFSSTRRRMTAGVSVAWYPMPIMGAATSLRDASIRNSVNTSDSEQGSGRRNRSSPIPGGRTAATSSSSEAKPSSANIASVSLASGPMCRR